MSAKPGDVVLPSRGTVAIIGRPNVGKSTLFNIFTGTRKAVVKDQPGVTRDIQIAPVEWLSSKFDLMDTGGLTDAADQFSVMIKEQVLRTLQSVDLVIVVLDGRAGLCPEDRDVMRIVHRSEKPFLLVINKVDSRQDEENARIEFSEFSSESDVVATSFEQRRGLDEILEWIVARLPEKQTHHTRGLCISVLGKPNVGKSSFCNYLMGSERMLVSETAGTTVDAVDLEFERNGKQYTIIDTAGLRKQARRKDDVEIISAFKSEGSIYRADIILLMVDGTEGPTEQDAKMAEMILEKHKGLILVANKSDIGNKEIPAYRSGFREKVSKVFHFFEDIKIVFVSAKTGAGMDELFETIDETWTQLNFRISTSALNKFFTNVIRLAPAPVYGTKNVSFYYLTQTQQRPPSFIAFTNFPDGVTTAYRRFVAKKIKEEWNLSGIPIRIFAMKKGRDISAY
ncbi:MAG: ribosome biogenesis GTPase Der [Bdellovibrionales bacterium]